MKNAFLAGLDGLGQRLDQFFVKTTCGNAFKSAGFALAGIHQHQLDIRGETEFASAAFTQG